MKKLVCLMLTALMVMSSLSALAEEKSLRDYTPLKELSADDGFYMGAALSYGQMGDALYLTTVMHHFDTITPTNELKAYSLLDQRASQTSTDGMPHMDYTKADKMVEWAQKAGLKVRGHVLVWDAYMTQWFFHEDYDTSKPIADRETMKKRMQSYIEDVICHFEDKYPGVVYCWDVVNEAIGEGADEFVADDPRHLRTKRSGSINPFYEYVGEDYVELAFYYAHDIVDLLGADIKLFYNDYNMFNMKKRAAAIELVKSINSYAKDAEGNPIQLCDGVGMQGYIGGYGTQAGCMKESNLSDIKKSILAYAELGVEVQITEMAVRNYDETKIAEHAAFYQKLFKVFKSINRDQETSILTNVAIWGLVDTPYEPTTSYSYKMNGTYGGLFGYGCKVKEAFLLVHEELAAD
ncbi:MAG: endo-1,4-beta-xylanase [Clostridia bacterium]|nr:endo-1,4-beta-xylanase [Clostridia bacterium]